MIQRLYISTIRIKTTTKFSLGLFRSERSELSKFVNDFKLKGKTSFDMKVEKSSDREITVNFVSLSDANAYELAVKSYVTVKQFVTFIIE